MTVEAMLLVLTTLIALVAVVVAAIAVRSVRDLKRTLEAAPPQPAVEMAAPAALETSSARGFEVAHARTESVEMRPLELAPRVVEGRVIVPPTQAQVVRTALGRPGVRLSILAHGLARALRAENRDRIVALMRREYRHRRRERLRAGRRAVRVTRPTSAPSTDRLHAEFVEPRPLRITDRMIRS